MSLSSLFGGRGGATPECKQYVFLYSCDLWLLSQG